MVEKLNIDLNQTPEKFQHSANKVLEFLTDKLQTLDKLEQEIFERMQALKNPAQPNQVQPGENELWKEYALRSKELIDPISVESYKSDRRSFGQPTKYAYFTYPGTKIVFIMKSANRAVVETYYEYGIEKKQQFVLKQSEDSWKIDSKKYGFPDEDIWYSDEI